MFVESNKQEFRFRTVKRNKREVSICTRVVFGTVLMTAVALTPLMAAPTGGVVQHGSANITVGTDSVINQYSPRVDITWTGFDTTSAESVTFNQQFGGQSVAINRISGPHTQFDGLLSAPGHVYLINPNGMTFGANAYINVGAFLATTGMPEDGFAGSDGYGTGNSLDFSNDSTASIINNGTIFINGGQGEGLTLDAGVGGFAILAAAHVVNNGTIQANAGWSVDGGEGPGPYQSVWREGQVELDSTQNFTLNKDSRGDGLMTLAPTEQIETEGEELAVTNTGTLRSRSGNVYLRANMVNAQLMARTVNLDGVVDADALEGSNNGGTILVASATDIKFDDLNDDGVGADIHARGGNDPTATFVAAENIESVEGSPTVSIAVEAESDYHAEASVRMRAVEDITLNADITVKADVLNADYSSAEAYAQLDVQAGNQGTFEEPQAGIGDLVLDGDVIVAATATSNGSSEEGDGAIAEAVANLDAGGSVSVTTGDETVNVLATASALEEGDATADASLNIGTWDGDEEIANNISVEGTVNVIANATAAEDSADADAEFVLTTYADADGEGAADGSILIDGDATVEATATAYRDTSASAHLWTATRAVGGWTDGSEGEGETTADGSVTIIGDTTVKATAKSTHFYSDAVADAGLHIASIDVYADENTDYDTTDGSVTIIGDGTVEAVAEGGENATANADYEFGSWLGWRYDGVEVPERLGERVSGIQVEGYEGNTDASINVTGDSTVTAAATITDGAEGHGERMYGDAFFGLRSCEECSESPESWVEATGEYGDLNASINITGDTRVTATTQTDFGMDEGGDPAMGYLSDGAESNARVDFYGRRLEQHADGLLDASMNIIGLTEANASNTVLGETGYSNSWASIQLMDNFDVLHHGDGDIDVSLEITGDLTAKSSTSATTGDSDNSAGARMEMGGGVAHYGGGFIDATTTITGDVLASATGALTGGMGTVGTSAEVGIYGPEYSIEEAGFDDSITIDGSTTVRSASTINAPEEEGSGYASTYAYSRLDVFSESGSVTLGDVTAESIADNQSGYAYYGNGASADAYVDIGAGSDVNLAGNVLVSADGDAKDSYYGDYRVGVNAHLWVAAGDGGEWVSDGDLNITGDTVDVIADANLYGTSGQPVEGAASAMAGAILAASGDVTIGTESSYTDINVTANSSSAKGRLDGADALAGLLVMAGTTNGPHMESLFYGDTLDDLLDEEWNFRHADLTTYGDITVTADAEADQQGYGGAFAHALSVGLLAAGDDINITTDPVRVIANADINATPEANGYGGAYADAVLGIVAGLNYDEPPEGQEDDVYGDITIRGDVSSEAHANNPLAMPYEPELTLEAQYYGPQWEDAFALTALVPEMEYYEGAIPLGSLTIRGRDPLARADTNPVPDQNQVLVQQQTSAGGICEDGICEGGPLSDDPLEALEFIMMIGEYSEYDSSRSLAGLILAGDPIDISPDTSKRGVPSITDRLQRSEPPNPAFPGDHGLSFDPAGNMIPADSLAEGTLPPPVPGAGDNTPLFAGDPTALLAPTAAGPGQGGEGDDYCNQLVNGACEQEETNDQQL